MKILFACDLDNTLIHSYKYRCGGDICVEMYNGREQSFMSENAVKLLERVNSLENIEFVPVTTRSITQYRRIELPHKCKGKYALAVNGTVLLNNENEETEWRKNTQKKTDIYSGETKRLYEKYKNGSDFTKVEIIDGMYLFVCCENSGTAEKYAEDFRKDTFLDVQCSGRKIYFFTPFSDKGTAVKRFANEYGFDHIICAGDSIIDIPMLKAADLAFIPVSLESDMESMGNCKICSKGNFAEFILSELLKWHL